MACCIDKLCKRRLSAITNAKKDVLKEIGEKIQIFSVTTCVCMSIKTYCEAEHPSCSRLAGKTRQRQPGYCL